MRVTCREMNTRVVISAANTALVYVSRTGCVPTGADPSTRRPAGGGDWVQLPFSGIQSPADIAVDSDGNVYVVAAEKFKGLRVVKLAVG